MEKVEVLSHMVGTIVSINVKEGEQVAKDQELFVIESMKMEITVSAPQGGTVEKILVKEGDFVNEGDPVIVLKPES